MGRYKSLAFLMVFMAMFGVSCAAVATLTPTQLPTPTVDTQPPTQAPISTPEQQAQLTNNGGVQATHPTGAVSLDNLAPDFSIVLYRGEEVLGSKEVRLSQLLNQGKPIILNFWSDWNPISRQEAPQVQTFYEKYGDRVIIVGVGIWASTPENIEEFLTGFGITYPSGIVANAEEVSQLYGISGTPANVFIAPDGRIINKTVGIISPEKTLDIASELLRASGLPPLNNALGSNGASLTVSQAKGKEIFTGKGACSSCHLIKGVSNGAVGPDLSSIGINAEFRIPGISAREYIFQSIINPEAFVPSGVAGANPGIMTGALTSGLTDQEVDALVEYLLGATATSTATIRPPTPVHDVPTPTPSGIIRITVVAPNEHHILDESGSIRDIVINGIHVGDRIVDGFQINQDKFNVIVKDSIPGQGIYQTVNYEIP